MKKTFTYLLIFKKIEDLLIKWYWVSLTTIWIVLIFLIFYFFNNSFLAN